MNTNLLNIVKLIVSTQGEGILCDPQRLHSVFSGLAKNEPKEERVAFGRCIEIGAYQELSKTRNAPYDRRNVKTNLANRLQAKSGLDTRYCIDAVDLLEEVMFPSQSSPSSSPASAPSGQHIGTQNIQVIYQQNQQNANPNQKLRHGFVSFWLWAGLIASVFGLILMVFLLFLHNEFYDIIGPLFQLFYPAIDSEIFLWILTGISVFTTVGLWKLVKNWKKSGFTFLLIGGIASVIIGFAFDPGFQSILSGLSYPLLTYFVMKIRHAYNGKSTWEQLD